MTLAAKHTNKGIISTGGYLLVLILSVVLLSACADKPQPVTLTGSTMGTSWSLKYWSDKSLPDMQTVREAVQQELDRLEQMMSTYRNNSDIQVFNQSQSLEWQPVPAELATVSAAALGISALSEGAYDITVAPLVDLWGFGPVKTDGERPSQEAIKAALDRVGYQKLNVNQQPPQLKKQHTDLTIDLSSIAKGFAVDQVAQQLTNLQISNYMLEVGGELTTRGISHRGTAWRIAIEKPVAGMPSVQLVINPENMGVATSGDYRNFYEDTNGNRFSHTIDPVTGMPVKNRLASVTVILPSVMLADGYATALTALGAEKAINLAEKNAIAAFFIIREGDTLRTIASTAFQQYIPEQEK